MRNLSRPPSLFAVLLGLFTGFAVAADRPAEAVLPGVVQPLQTLLSFLPQLLVGGLLAAAVLFRLDTWRLLAGRVRDFIGRRGRTWAVALVLALALVAAAVWRFVPGPRVVAGGGGGSPPPPPSTWTSFMGGPLRTGNADGATGPREGRLAWSFRGGLDRAGFASSAAAWNGRVYVGCDDHKLYCFDAANGDVLWTFALRHECFSSPVVAGGRVFVGEGLHETVDARFYCIDAMTGKEAWSVPTHSHTESTATVVDDRVFTGGGGDGFYCLDAATGRTLWRFEGPHVDSSAVVADGNVWFGSGYGHPSVYCLDAASGALRWKKAMRFQAWGPPSYAAGRLYVGTGNGDFTRSGPDPAGEVLCLEAATGEVAWTVAVPDSVMTSIALWGGVAYFGSHDGGLYCVDASTGKRRWRFATEGRVLSSPAVDSDRVYVGSTDGRVYAVRASDGTRVWAFDARAQAMNTQYDFLASPTLAGGRLFIGCQNYYFFSLR